MTDIQHFVFFNGLFQTGLLAGFLYWVIFADHRRAYFKRVLLSVGMVLLAARIINSLLGFLIIKALP